MRSLRISATAHGINYLPEYFAARNGGFAALGLEVQATPRDPWTGVLDDLADDSADVALGGLWVPIMYAGRGRELVAVGQLNARFPMVVVTREPSEDFAWSSLKGMIVLAPGAGGTAPYEFTAGLMREAGCDPAETIFVRDLSTDMLVELFRNGAGDAIVADPFTATTLAVAGVGHFACHLADVGGVMPNSVYYVRRDRLDELHEALIALLHGVSDAMTAITDGAPIAEVIAAEWPNGPHAILEASAARLVTNGTWSGVGIDEAACDRWAGMLHERGLAGAVTFADVVDTRALAAIGRDEP